MNKNVNKVYSKLKGRLFNMDIPKKLETALRNKIRSIAILAGFLSLGLLFFMMQFPKYFIASLVTGLLAMTIDFVIEYIGITKNRWNYPTHCISFRKVPVEIPFLFFSCGVFITFTFWYFSTIVDVEMIIPNSGITPTQIVLFLTGLFFIVQYLKGNIKSLVFWMLPISIGLYLFFLKPWILVASIVPMYIDYYLEKKLVKTANITYDRYDEELATNVAISYFFTTLFIFCTTAIVLQFLG